MKNVLLCCLALSATTAFSQELKLDFDKPQPVETESILFRSTKNKPMLDRDRLLSFNNDYTLRVHRMPSFTDPHQQAEAPPVMKKSDSKYFFAQRDAIVIKRKK